jgi:hypothetical protein
MMLANPRGIEGMMRLSRFVDTNSSLMSEPYAWMRWVVASLRIHLLRKLVGAEPALEVYPGGSLQQ